jgi:hypothetical protein
MAPKNLRRRIVRLEVPTYVSFAHKAKGTFFDHLHRELKTHIIDPAKHPFVMFIPKNGWYLDRKANFSWIYYEGEHYCETVGMHKYTLRLLRARSFSMNEEAAIRAMTKVRLPIPNALGDQWEAYLENRTLKRQGWDIKKHGLESRKRLIKFKEERGIK